MIETDVPKTMIKSEARLLLNAVYDGPWRAIAALVKHEIMSALYRHAGARFEFVRTRVFRRVPDPVLEIANRVAEEDAEVCKMIKAL